MLHFDSMGYDTAVLDVTEERLGMLHFDRLAIAALRIDERRCRRLASDVP
jgi:hypothetical protein